MLDVDYACRVSRISVSNIGIDNRILSGTLKKKIDLRFTPILSWAFVIFFDLVVYGCAPNTTISEGLSTISGVRPSHVFQGILSEN